jgi:NADH dehydrogenase
VDVVTGAFSYTGRAIADTLLARGGAVRTLSRSPAPAGSPVEAVPFNFDHPAALRETLRGAETLYNTYWIRFPHGRSTYERAVRNTNILLQAAREAGVRRFVHVSVTRAALDSPLPYFRGKAVLERDVAASGLSYAIVRPTLVFGPRDILVNNIAWLLRRAPAFLLPGDGSYRVQPVSVADVARLAVDAPDGVVEAAGPDVIPFAELVALVRDAVGSRARIVPTPPRAALALGAVAGAIRRDVILTREELDGLMRSLLVAEGPATGGDRFEDWVRAHAGELGRRYVSELARNFRRHAPL